MAGVLSVNKAAEGEKLTLQVIGRVDTVTAPQLEDSIRESLQGVEDLVFDLSQLEYISSAGLRVLLSTQKIMNKQGEMTLRGVNEDIMEIFEVTGFVDILDIEE